MKEKLPKILIITETFKNNTGGGITLSNLFNGYPKEKLANAVDAFFISQIADDSICNNFYALGSSERKAIGLFSFLKSDYPSGKYIFNKNSKNQTQQIDEKKIKKFFKKLFFKVSYFFGLNHFVFKTQLSQHFKEWVKEFSPDIIYSQLGSLENINFTKELVVFTDAKLAIHIMDDWPRVIGNYGLFKTYWNKRIDKEFFSIVKMANICLSISEGMSEEYQKRYQKEFHPFHNPIDTKMWLRHVKRDFKIENKKIKVLYAGRIGRGIENALHDCVLAIKKLSYNGMLVELQIQTTSNLTDLKYQLNEYDFIKINPIIEYDRLPEVFSNVDLLLMPFDFCGEGFDFLKLSMPTKASEYMISGTPVLLYASDELSITKHAKKYQWAHCISINDIDILSLEINNLLNNETLRQQISQNAVSYAISHFEKEIVRKDFQEVFFKSQNL